MERRQAPVVKTIRKDTKPLMKPARNQFEPEPGPTSGPRKEPVAPPEHLRLTVTGYHAIRKDDDFRKGKWRDEALCVKICKTNPRDFDPEDWFPKTPQGQSARTSVPPAIKQVCMDCTVRLECLVYAIWTAQPDGIWAGHNAKTIKKLRRRIV